VGSRVIPIRLNNETLALIDTLVRLGVFSSRSEALRELIRAGIESYSGLARIAEAVEKLLEIEKKEGRSLVELSGAVRELLTDRRSRF